MDQLRLVAASQVLLYHSFHRFAGLNLNTRFPLLTLIDEGHMGVSLFMVLSGFIFTVISYGKNVAYGNFLYNRVLRIYPLLFFIMFLELYTSPADYTMINVFSFVLPFSNLTQGVIGGIASQMWTVAVEFQFYLIFPFLIAFVSRRGTRYLLGLALLLLVTRGLAYLQKGTVQNLAYVTIFGRLEQLVIGMACGILHRRNRRRFENPWWLFLGGAIVLTYTQLFGAFGGYYGNTPLGNERRVFWVFWPGIEAMAWACFALPYIQCHTSYGSFLESLLAKFGKYSYSIYALHIFVLRAVGVVAERHFTGIPVYDGLIYGLGIILPVTIALSALSYHVIEAPFLSMRVKYASTESHLVASG